MVQVLEHASVCLTRIAEAFAASPDKLDELCNHGLVTQAASLISTSNPGGGQTSLSTPTYTVSLIFASKIYAYLKVSSSDFSMHAGINPTSFNLCKWVTIGSQNITSSWD